MLLSTPLFMGVQHGEGAWTVSHMATARATTISIDIGKIGCHLIGLDVRYGSEADILQHCHLSPLSEAKWT